MQKNIILPVALLSAFLLVGSASAHEDKVGLNFGLESKLESKNEISDLKEDRKEDNRKEKEDDSRHMKSRMTNNLRLGVVTKVNTDGSFTVTSANGKKTATLTTDTATVFQKDGQVTTKSAVVVGSKLNLKGTFDKATSTIKASLVNIIERLRGAHVRGTVTAITGTSITVRDDFGTNYTVDATTAKFVQAKTLADIKVGDEIMVSGTHLKDSTTISAKTIVGYSIEK